MALPTKEDLQALDYSFDGSPFCQVPASPSIDTNGLDWSFDGSPFWAISGAVQVVRRLKAYIGGIWTSKPLKYWNGSAWIEKELKKL